MAVVKLGLGGASLLALVAALGGCVAAGSGEQGSTSSSSSSGGSSSTSVATSPVNVQVLAINDFHGHLEPPTGSNGRITLANGTRVDTGGAAYLAAHLNTLRDGHQNSITVSAGDLIGASPLTSGLFHDEPAVEAMNLMGLDLNSVGNHEFDKGVEELLRMQHGGCHPVDGCREGHSFTGANFHFLAANVKADNGNGPTVFPPYEIRYFEGLPVAFIGMTLEGTGAIVNPSGITGLRFMDEVETANALVTELQGQGVEAIIVLLHEGGLTTGSYDACQGISGPVVEIAQNLSRAVDVVLSGHTHQAYNCTIAGKIVTSAASFGRVITQLDLVVDNVTKDITSKTATNTLVTRDSQDDAVGALVESYKSIVAPLANRVVGSITATLASASTQQSNGLSAMGAVVADAQLDATKDAANGGAQIAITNPGGVRADLQFAASAGESGNGVVRYAELFTVQPFGNNLVVMSLTGAQIRVLLEQQLGTDTNGNLTADILQISAGFSYTIQTSAAAGSRIPMSGMMLNGQPMAAGTSYRVAVNSYLAAGGDGFSVFLDGQDQLGGPLELDALVAYFEAHSPVAPPELNRVLAQ